MTVTRQIKPIGGYFELELPVYPELHADAIALNSGRFCLEYILRCRHYKKVYVPYFTCDSAIEPIKKLGVPYEFYHIDKEYRIIGEIRLNDGETLMYTNYWGLQDAYCQLLASKYGRRLILDYTQAFYSEPIIGIDTFYSCRKFFGVPDGGYLYTDAQADFEIVPDESYMRMNSLVKRIDISPEAGFQDFHNISSTFHEMPIRKMSNFTKRMMGSIDYERAARRRIDNYNTLWQQLGGKILNYGEIPMIYPYTSEAGQKLREDVIAKMALAAYEWRNVHECDRENSLETWMANHILPLPIDQRYGREDMERIVQIIRQ